VEDAIRTRPPKEKAGLFSYGMKKV